jgi:hypothetical protein
MLHIASYASPLGTPTPLTSHAIQSKADARQRVGGNPTIPLNQLKLEFEKALGAYNSRKPLKDGGSCRVNYDLVTAAIDSLNQLLEHPDLPNDNESESLRTLQSELIEKRAKYEPGLKSWRPRQVKKSRPFPSHKLSLLSKRFWNWLERSLYRR